MHTYLEDKVVQKNRWWILVAVSMFTFMSTLDGSIVNIALPTISKDMQVPMNQSEWIVSIYLMMVCACLLLFGKIGDSWGKIKIYRIGTLIFVIGSLLCGFNHSLAFLLFARVIQALGAAMTMATNTGIITEVFPMNERGRALGMIGAFVSLGSIAGPGLGGLILAHFSWAYIFWINVPVGIITMVISEKFLPKDITLSGQKIDMGGFAAIAATIMTFFGGVFLGQEHGFLTLIPLVLFALAIISFIVFLYVEKKVKLPLITFSIFKNKVFTMSLITALLIFSSNFFVNVVIPLFQSPNNTMVMSSVTKENLGVAGSLNSFARNLGMVIGISMATTILYNAMSSKMGERVTTYIANRPDVFIYGMKITFLGSFLLCLVALLLTLYRVKKQGGIRKHV